MNSRDFNHIVQSRLERIQSLLTAKAAEYAPPDSDRLHNFKRAGEMLNCTPEQALIGMWTKHVISILDIVNGLAKGETYTTDLINEKIGDAINYLILLEALLKEKKLI